MRNRSFRKGRKRSFRGRKKGGRKKQKSLNSYYVMRGGTRM